MNETTSIDAAVMTLGDCLDGSVLTCPSGLRVRLRPMKMADQRVFQDRVAAKRGMVFINLLAACTLETLCDGPYRFNPAGTVKWAETLQGDRFAALLALRILTHGDAYKFSVTCQNCRSKYEWGLSLLADLEVKQLPADIADRVRAGQFNTTAVFDGATLTIRLMRAADEAELQRLVVKAKVQNSGQDANQVALAHRIVSVSGVADCDKSAWLDDQPIGLMSLLRDVIEASDGGVDTEVSACCPHCDTEADVGIPLDGDFFIPRRTR